MGTIDRNGSTTTSYEAVKPKFKFKKGDICVRTGISTSNSIIFQKKGDIEKCWKEADRFFYDEKKYPGTASSCNNVRHATQTEIEAYNNGIRNINEIPTKIELNYEIY